MEEADKFIDYLCAASDHQAIYFSGRVVIILTKIRLIALSPVFKSHALTGLKVRPYCGCYAASHLRHLLCGIWLFHKKKAKALLEFVRASWNRVHRLRRRDRTGETYDEVLLYWPLNAAILQCSYDALQYGDYLASVKLNANLHIAIARFNIYQTRLIRSFLMGIL